MNKQLMVDILRAIKNKDTSTQYIDDANMVDFIEKGEVRYGEIKSCMQHARNQCWIESLESQEFRAQFVAATKLTSRGERVLNELTEELQRKELSEKFGKIHPIDSCYVNPPSVKDGKFILVINHITKIEGGCRTIQPLVFDIGQLELICLQAQIHSALEART